MKKKRYIYLISEQDALQVAEVSAEYQLDKCVCKNKALSWITYDTLEAFRSIGVVPDILQQRELLPVFHDKNTGDIKEYDPGLSVYALALNPTALGVVYVGWGCETQIAGIFLSYRRFFFHYPEVYGKDFIWAIIPSSEDDDESILIQWIYRTLYGGDEDIKLFLEGLGASLNKA